VGKKKWRDMDNKIIVTINDYHRLMGLMEYAAVRAKMPEIAGKLYQRLCEARMVSQTGIAERVITMNSRVWIKEVATGRETEITITYPEDAAAVDRRISVFSTIGLALLGRMENETVSWVVPRGIGRFEIVKVTYQPEAAGHYYL
jgi:regulator of nucleoside diphosphate kinase